MHIERRKAVEGYKIDITLAGQEFDDLFKSGRITVAEVTSRGFPKHPDYLEDPDASAIVEATVTIGN